MNEVDILISDVLTDDEIGLSLFEKILTDKIPVKIIVYSNITSKFVKQFLYEYGVLAFLNKKYPLEKIGETIQLVELSAQYKHKQLNNHMLPQLTIKEKEIAKYLAKGLGAKEIAALTNSSVNTINNQKSHLIRKSHCTNSTELVLKLVQMGYLKR